MSYPKDKALTLPTSVRSTGQLRSLPPATGTAKVDKDNRRARLAHYANHLNTSAIFRVSCENCKNADPLCEKTTACLRNASIRNLIEWARRGLDAMDVEDALEEKIKSIANSHTYTGIDWGEDEAPVKDTPKDYWK